MSMQDSKWHQPVQQRFELTMPNHDANAQGTSSERRLDKVKTRSIADQKDRDRLFRYKFSMLQRQMLQHEMANIKEKLDEMKGRDARIKQKFIELQHKRRLLEVDQGDFSKSQLDFSPENTRILRSRIGKLHIKGTETPEKQKSSDLTVDGSEHESMVVQVFATGGATERDAPPIPPPRRRREKMKTPSRNGGRAGPYKTPEKGTGSPRKQAFMSPRRSQRVASSAKKSATPAKELNQLTAKLQSAKKQRAPSRPSTPLPGPTEDNTLKSNKPKTGIIDLGVADLSGTSAVSNRIRNCQLKLNLSDNLSTWTKSNTVTGKRQPGSHISRSSSICTARPIKCQSSIDLSRSSAVGATRFKKGQSSFDLSNSKWKSTPVGSKTSRSRLGSRWGSRSSSAISAPGDIMDVSAVSGTKSDTSLMSTTTNSSFNTTHNTTQWSLFNVSSQSQKENKCNKSKNDSDTKPKRGLRKSKSGNKIFPVTLLNKH